MALHGLKVCTSGLFQRQYSDYNPPYKFNPSSIPRGIGAHPHRGFETVTLAFKGYVELHDNTGEHGIIGPGDVQWMTAESGILHKEYLEGEFNKAGGVLHMIQLWVNLPTKEKLTLPKYQELVKENMGSYTIPNNGGNVSIIAGEFKGIKGPASTFTPINMYTITLENNGELDFVEPSNFNTGIWKFRFLKVDSYKFLLKNVKIWLKPYLHIF